MRIDVIVPNFDQTSKDIVMSTWYKKVGDIIYKNEVIADAETETVACGITSSYDCVLVKVLVKEGEVITPGSKIAIIETELTQADSIKTLNVARSESSSIDSKLRKEKQIYDNEQVEVRAEQQKLKQAKEAQDNKEIQLREITKAADQIRNIDSQIKNSNKVAASDDKLVNDVKSSESKSIASADDSVVAFHQALPNKNKSNADIKDTISNVNNVENDSSDTKISTENEGADVLDNAATKIAQEYSEHSKNKILNILSATEESAKQEAAKLRDQIIYEAKTVALQEAAKIRDSIMRDYESKAIEQATNVHKDIIQTSLTESENTRKKLLADAEIKAQAEANSRADEIIAIARQEAKSQAAKSIKEAIENAKVTAETESSDIAKEIIQKAVDKAQNDSVIIERDILHNAKIQADEESEQIILNAIRQSKHEAADVVEKEIVSITDVLLEEACSDIKYLIQERALSAKAKAEDIFAKELERAMTVVTSESKSVIDSAISDAKTKIDTVTTEYLRIYDEVDLGHLREFIKTHIYESKEAAKATIEALTNECIKLYSDQELDVLKSFIKENIAISQENIKENIASIISTNVKLYGETAKCEIDNFIQECVAQERAKARLDIELEIIQYSNESKEELRKNIATFVQEQSNEMREIIEVNCHDFAEEISIVSKQEIKDNMAVLVEKSKANTDVLIKDIVSESILEATKKAFLIKGIVLNDEIDKLKFSQSEDDIIKSHKYNDMEKKAECIYKNCVSDESLKKCTTKKSISASDEEYVRKLIEDEICDGSDAEKWSKPKFFLTPGESQESIDILKKRISEKAQENFNASVISTISSEIDMTAVLSMEQAFGKEFSQMHNTRLGFTPFFIIACVGALKKYRVFNSHIIDNSVIYKNSFDISVVTCGNEGVVVPVIRNVDELNFAEIEKSMITLSKRAMDGTLSLEEVSGGTFTIINAGIYGSIIGTDLLTPPQVATLSVHKMTKRPVATDNGVEVRPVLYVSLSYDHRIADPKKASDFLEYIKKYVENPGWQMLSM